MAIPNPETYSIRASFTFSLSKNSKSIWAALVLGFNSANSFADSISSLVIPGFFNVSFISVMIDSQNTSWSASFNCPNVSGDSFSRSSLFILSEALDYCCFNPASLFLASSTSDIPGSASFQRVRKVCKPSLKKNHEWSEFS